MKKFLAIVAALLIVMSACAEFDYNTMVPPYCGYPYVEINDNIPFFTTDEIVNECYEYYSPLDSLGRCGYAMACVGPETLPTAKRGSISNVRPSGWQTATYPDVIKDRYLYNRCHLLGYQLTAENANKCNLIAGTRYLNIEGMLPFEDEVAAYVGFMERHVIYRVTPIFVGNELVARGVLMEAIDYENHGNSVQFCVFCYNVQPQIVIDYLTGDSRYEIEEEKPQEIAHHYILNTSTKKIHSPSCSYAAKIADKNRAEYSGSVEDLFSMGYTLCKTCNP